jgi:F420-non-reducing hydrogenase small subunit
MYWASSCGGCEIAIVNLHERLLTVAENFDFVFCPCLLDGKKRDIEEMGDGSIAITLFNGAVRTAENLEMAHLLRRKSRVLVGFGSCAMEGGIPALSNLHSRADHLQTIYLDNPSLDNPSGVTPQTRVSLPEGELELPAFFDRVGTLAETVGVDYFVPGCPPESHRIWEVLEGIIGGRPFPPKGSVLGSGASTVCDACTRPKGNKAIERFYRTYEIVPEPEKCLLEQGILCIGSATRDGCGALCPRVNMPCMGCYGPAEGILDQGAKMLAALGSVVDIGSYKGLSEQQIAERADGVFDSIPDQAGAFYKFSLAGSILGGRLR